MANLVVMKFHTAEGADAALGTIRELATQHLITVIDAAVVTWPQGKKKPRTRQLSDMTATGALNGAFWGMLFGMIFFVPLLGMAMGAAMGAMRGSMVNLGINEEFVARCRDSITEGTSALFLMAKDATMDKVVEGMKMHRFEILSTNLSNEQEEALKQAFGLEG